MVAADEVAGLVEDSSSVSSESSPTAASGVVTNAESANIGGGGTSGTTNSLAGSREDNEAPSAEASVLVAERSVVAELAKKAVPASADGASLSSLEPARLLVVPEVPPPDVSAFNTGGCTTYSGRGPL